MPSPAASNKRAKLRAEASAQRTPRGRRHDRAESAFQDRLIGGGKLSGRDDSVWKGESPLSHRVRIDNTELLKVSALFVSPAPDADRLGNDVPLMLDTTLPTKHTPFHDIIRVYLLKHGEGKDYCCELLDKAKSTRWEDRMKQFCRVLGSDFTKLRSRSLKNQAYFMAKELLRLTDNNGQHIVDQFKKKDSNHKKLGAALEAVLDKLWVQQDRTWSPGIISDVYTAVVNYPAVTALEAAFNDSLSAITPAEVQELWDATSRCINERLEVLTGDEDFVLTI